MSMAESVDAADLKSASENCAGSTPATHTTSSEIYVSVELTHSALVNFAADEIGPFIKRKLAIMLVDVIMNRKVMYEFMSNSCSYTETYSAKLNVFTDKELKEHDQDVIEEFCSRKD